MQRLLWYDPLGQGAAHVPELTVVDTPNLALRGGPVVAVWPEDGVTRIIGTDYFDEAKKAGVRMWAERVFDTGGLVLHAGCKLVGGRTMLVIGLPDAGKTTVVFAREPAARVVQDDFVGLLPGGRVVASEDGCIEKTRGLEPARQPAVFAAATRPEAWLENVPQRGAQPDFSASSPAHARAVFSLAAVDRVPPDAVPPASVLVLLVRDEAIAPAVARLDPLQAAAWFMLPGLRATAPGDPGQARLGNRLAELLASSSIDAFLLNTARVGLADLASTLRAVLANEVTVAYADVADERLPERRRHLASFPGLDPRVAGALG
jgi:phosphoenolpyruvate carboxykinase (ATP)